MLKTTRRAALLALSLLAAALTALAADPVKLVVPFPPGGSLDFVGRLVADKLKDSIGAPVIVDNRAGANGNIGSQAVAQATPNGQTLLMASDGVVTVNPLLFKVLNFDGSRDLAPIGTVALLPSLLVVPANSSIKTLADLIAEGRKRELTYASGGLGSAGHLTMAYLASTANLKSLHIPFQGGAPAMAALMGGQVDVAFVAAANAVPHVNAGKLRALAISSSSRMPQLPDVPTVAESGYTGFEVETGYLLMAPAKLPADIRKRLGKQLADVARSTEFQTRVRDQLMKPVYLDESETTAWLARERKRWAALIEKHGISSK